jgi:predicted small lipoprotein YifL
MNNKIVLTFITSALVMTFLLSSCGQKGSLYIPKSELSNNYTTNF